MGVEKQYRWWCEACGTLTNDGDCDCTRFEHTRKKQRLRPADFDEDCTDAQFSRLLGR